MAARTRGKDSVSTGMLDATPLGMDLHVPTMEASCTCEASDGTTIQEKTHLRTLVGWKSKSLKQLRFPSPCFFIIGARACVQRAAPAPSPSVSICGAW